MLKYLATPLLVLCFLLMSTGCTCPALVYWSPDGSRAVYRLGPSSAMNGNYTKDAAAAFIIDADGKILGRIDDIESPGSTAFAWSADSKRLYYAQNSIKPFETPTTPLLLDRLNIPAEQAKQVIDSWSPRALGQKRVQQVHCYEDGSSTPLFSITGSPAWFMEVLADRYLLLLAPGPFKTQGRVPQHALYVYCLRTGHLHLLSLYCAGKYARSSIISLIEPDAVTSDGLPSHLGRVATIDLNELDRMNGVRQHQDWEPQVQMIDGSCLGACTGGILMTGHSLALPSAGIPWPQSEYTLFFKPYSESWRPLVEDIGPYFIPNPDGTLVLLEKRIKRPVPDHPSMFYAAPQSDLVVLDVATGSPHTLVRRIAFSSGGSNAQDQIPMVPAWRGKREICFIAPPDARRSKTGQPRYEVALYRITDDWKLKLSKTLSDNWSQEIKPLAPFRDADLGDAEFELSVR